jgi:uncharacterized protein (TIGR02246 family)
MKHLMRVLLATALVSQSAFVLAQSKGDEDAVRNIPQEFAAAWAKHDGHQLAKLMALDVDFVTVGADWLHGRPDFEVYHSRLLSTRFKDAQLTVGEVKVRFLRPDLAVLHWSWTVAGDRNEDMTPRPPRTGLMTMIVENKGTKNLLTEATHKDRDWLVEAAQNTDWMPGPVPELDGINPPIVMSGPDPKLAAKQQDTPVANQFTPAPLATPSAATAAPANSGTAADPSAAPGAFTPAPLATPSATSNAPATPADPSTAPGAFTPAPLATPASAAPAPAEPAAAPNTYMPPPLATTPGPTTQGTTTQGTTTQGTTTQGTMPAPADQSPAK